jgi:site-specific DNA-methyltransferase (adenine-specific)
VEANDGYEKAWDKPIKTNISNGSSAFDTGVSAQRGTHEVDISANKPVGGRWPANIILDEEAAQMLDEQSGWSQSKASLMKADPDNDGRGTWQMRPRKTAQVRGHSDSEGASRFFYVAKASKAEREAGLEGMDVSINGIGALRDNGRKSQHRANHHPTVKPIALMRYLVRMVTPRDGVVLDPFMGSGTTGCAAMLEEMRFIGIELNEEYLDIAERRIRYWLSTNMAKE